MHKMPTAKVTFERPEKPISISDVDTPALLVDLNKVERNVKRMFSSFGNGISIRPHLKTVKSPYFAWMFIEAGAAGVCVAKLSEAEVMAASGIEDILITTEIAGTAKIEKLLDLLKSHPRIKIVVDSKTALDAIGESASRRGFAHAIEVLIEVNVGQDRAGVEPGPPVLELAREVEKNPCFTLKGVQGYEGHLQLLTDENERRRLNEQAMTKLKESVTLLRSGGFRTEIVTTGGTGTAQLCAQSDVVNEVQPGSFVFMDSAYLKAIGERYESALELVSTVVSHPSPLRAVIDAGYKSLSTDSGFADVVEPINLQYQPAGDEHGILTAPGGTVDINVGARVRLMPSHIDTTVNLHDFFYCHRDGVVEAIVPILARGKVQ